MYYLVTLRDISAEAAAGVDHESFIDSLVSRNLVLLGGPLTGELAPGVTAAYVLRCADLAEASAVVGTDPLVASGACAPTIVGWELVGVNLAAVDPELTAG